MTDGPGAPCLAFFLSELSGMPTLCIACHFRRRCRNEYRTTTIAAVCRAYRCRQYLAANRRRLVRGGREVRRGERAPYLRRFFRWAAEIMGRHSAEVRYRSLSAVRLHQGQECVGHCPGDRRDGPAAQWPVRRLLSCILRQRFHEACLAAARTGRRRLRFRRSENAGEFPASLSPGHLHREPAAANGHHRRGYGIEVKIVAAAEHRDSDSGKSHLTNRERGWLGHAWAGRPAHLEPVLGFRDRK